MKNFAETFESVAAFSAALSQRDINAVFKNEFLSSDGKDAYFRGTKDFAEADTLLRAGDVEKLDMLSDVKLPQSDFEKKEMSRQKYTRSVAGGRPCVPLFLSGAPNCMFTKRAAKVPAKIIDLVYNIGADCTIGAETLADAGAKMLSVIKAIEAAGVRVNLFVTFITTSSSQYLMPVVKLKDSGAPLNLLSVAYPVVNPSFLRRHLFRWLERCPVEINKSFTGGYGSPCRFRNMPKKVLKELKSAAGLNNKSIYIDTVDLFKKTPDDIINDIYAGRI